MYLDAKNPFEAFNLVLGMLQQENNVLKEKANDIVPEVMPVGKWPALSDYRINQGYDRHTTLAHYETEWFKSYNYWREEAEYNATDLDGKFAALNELLDTIEKAVLKCWEDNEAAIENNKKVHEKIKLIMNHIKIPQYYSTYEYKTSRSSKKTETKHTAGYLGDLSRNVPTCIQGSKPDVKALRARVKAQYDKLLLEVNKKAQEKEKHQQEAQKVHELALLRAKYCPENALADVSEIRDALLAKDKYLRLAYWLERNRGDWSDGCDYAQTGLYGFVIDTTEDQEIYDEIESLCEDFEDGRVFRDCQYNYGVLYSMVEDATLLQDLTKLKEMENN